MPTNQISASGWRIGLPVALILAAATTATAAEDWRLTARSDHELLALVAELEGGAERAAADRESGLAAVCLLHERIFEC